MFTASPPAGGSENIEASSYIPCREKTICVHVGRFFVLSYEKLDQHIHNPYS